MTNNRGRLRHAATSRLGPWSPTLHVPPPTRRRSSLGGVSEVSDIISSPLSLLSPGSSITGCSLTGDELKLVELSNLCKVGSESAKIYGLCCYTLSKKVFFVIKELQRTGTIEVDVLKCLEIAIDLINKCNEPGWLQKLIIPPTPSWGSSFLKADNDLIITFLSTNPELSERLKHTEILNPTKLDYLDDLSYDYNGLSRSHFIEVYRELEGDPVRLLSRVNDFALDFDCTSEEFKNELIMEGLDKAMNRLDVGGEEGVDERVLAVGSPRSAVKGLKDNKCGRVASSQIIFLSGVEREVGFEMEKIRNFLKKKGLKVVYSCDDLRGSLEKDCGYFESLSTSILNSGVFIIINSSTYGNRKHSKQSFSELESARRFKKNIVVLGEEGSLGGEVIKYLDYDEECEVLIRYLSTLGISPNIAAAGDVSDVESSAFSEDRLQVDRKDGMDSKVKEWLLTSKLEDFIQPLQEYGVKNFEDLIKLTHESTWIDLEFLVADKRRLNRFLKKLNKKTRCEARSEATNYEYDVNAYVSRRERLLVLRTSNKRARIESKTTLRLEARREYNKNALRKRRSSFNPLSSLARSSHSEHVIY